MAGEGFGWGSALKWVWDNLDTVLERLKKVREWFRSDPSRGILIIGPGGVGKTTLAAILSGNFDWLMSNSWEYQESYGIEEYALNDDPKVEIVVPPGQVSRRDATWVDVERGLATGKYRGVILVGANGYHSMRAREDYRSHALYKGNKETFLADYCESCRNEELSVLERVAQSLQSAPGKVWLFSVATKEDLWWPTRQAATAFYSAGKYAEVLIRVSSIRGREQFRHELHFASCVIANFLSGTGEVLRKNTEGYDHQKQIESVRRLFEIIDALREWEEGT